MKKTSILFGNVVPVTLWVLFILIQCTLFALSYGFLNNNELPAQSDKTKNTFLRNTAQVSPENQLDTLNKAPEKISIAGF